MSVIKGFMFFLISAKSLAMSLIWYEMNASTAMIRETKRSTVIETASTCGKRNLEFKKWTIGNSNAENRKASSMGINTVLPI
jgi:hypothetical protein